MCDSSGFCLDSGSSVAGVDSAEAEGLLEDVSNVKLTGIKCFRLTGVLDKEIAVIKMRLTADGAPDCHHGTSSAASRPGETWAVHSSYM